VYELSLSILTLPLGVPGQGGQEKQDGGAAGGTGVHPGDT